ncbi:PhzF family phenazine biosynthesis protein [Aurantivibrio plasticivorans]
MPAPCFIVDAFTRDPFHGNPAAVVIVDDEQSDAWMQHVAAEFNLSETAFLRRRSDTEWDLRWFTPTVEVALCGHATLASAFTLFNEGISCSNQLTFHTQSGKLFVHQYRDRQMLCMDFPLTPIKQCSPNEALLDALDLASAECYRTDDRYLLVLPYEKSVANLSPDFSALKAFDPIIVTAPANNKSIDFVSRFFAPSKGINEDPVTGSAHCALAYYWREQLGKSALNARQISSRSGDLQLEVRGNRVNIFGNAVLVMRGNLNQ